MKSARSIIPSSPDEAFVHGFDLRDINADNPYSIWRLKYLERIGAILRLVRTHVQRGGCTLEIGAAQGNISLFLAEAGYEATAVELKEDFLTYSRKKHERGAIQWLCGNAFDLLLDTRFDAVILAEIVEHVAHPSDLIARALSLVEPGGVLVITTPNQHFVREHAPSYTAACKDVARMEADQFGPAGENHLFTLTMDELRSMVPPTGAVIEEFFVDGILYNHHMQGLWNNGATRSMLVPLAYRLRTRSPIRQFTNAGLVIAVRRTILA